MNDDQALISELERLARAAEHFENLPQQEQEAVHRSIKTAMEAHPVFRQSESRFFGLKQLMIDPWYQAFNLLKVSQTSNAVEAVNWLHKVYAATSANIRYVVEVHGLKLSGEIALSNRVRLLPLENLPLSPQANALIAQYRTFHGGPRAAPLFPPIGAFLEVPEIPAKADFVKSSQDFGPRSQELERTVRAFCLEGDAAPIIGIGWMEFVDPNLTLAEFGQMWMSPTRESDVSNSAPIEINNDSVAWVERYIQLPPDVRRVCDVATERLVLARRRHYPGNKAIEGAICLEALLGDGGTQELTYRLRLRSALLLATGLDQRQEISRAVREFYDLRSKTVHGAAVSSEEVQRQHACAARGIAICAAVLRAIVQLNKKYVPHDWELAGGDPEAS